MFFLARSSKIFSTQLDDLQQKTYVKKDATGTSQKRVCWPFTFAASTKSITLPVCALRLNTTYLGKDRDLDSEDRGFRLDGVEVGRFGPSKGSCQFSCPWMPGNKIKKYDNGFVLNAEIGNLCMLERKAFRRLAIYD